MVLIYVRHSKDEGKHPPVHRHDGHITSNGKKIAYQKGKKLIKKYGLPDICYVSPFERTKETLNYMLYRVSEEDRAKIQVIADPRLGRVFSKAQQQDPSVFTATREAGIQIVETTEQIKARVNLHIRELQAKNRSDQVIWCITHAIIFKAIAKYYKVEGIPKFIPFMMSFRVSSPDNLPPPRETLHFAPVCKKCGVVH